MAEMFRTPKAVLAETDLPASLTAVQVAELRDRDGETGAWARRIVAAFESRAAEVKETRMKTRAIGPDVPVADALAALLDETFELYIRAHEAHWNVAGTDFAEYHALFGEIYDDVYGSIDPMAENIRKVGSLVPPLCIEAPDERVSDSVALATGLLENNEELLVQIRAAFDVATAAGQQGIANFLAERQDAHAKWSWQLRSSLGVAEVGEPVTLVEDDETAEGEPMEMNAADLEVEARRSAIASAEKRNMPAELRTETLTDGTVAIRGYAAVFNREADGLPFREMIKPGAFARSLDNGDECYLLVNHNTDELPLARRNSGTLTLSEDETGLLMEAVLDPTNPRAAEVISVLTRGDASEMSFAFTVAPDGQTRTKDGLRELRELNLFEVSICTWGAYSDTSVGLRSVESGDDLELRRRQLSLKLKQLSI